MSRLEMWHEDGVVDISISDVAQAEAATGNAARARRAFSLIFTDTNHRTQEDEEALTRIERILFPDGPRTQNDRNDAQIVFSAWKHKHRLITDDGASRSQPGGILGHRDELLAELGISVISDAEAVAWVEGEVLRRDERAKSMHKDYNVPLPSWVGDD